jgi:hypothetical protein
MDQSLYICYLHQLHFIAQTGESCCDFYIMAVLTHQLISVWDEMEQDLMKGTRDVCRGLETWKECDMRIRSVVRGFITG